MFDVSTKEGAVVAVARLRRLDAVAAPEARRTLVEAGNGASILVIDLGTVELVDSSGVGTLVAALKALPAGGQVRLVHASPAVLGTLRVTRLDRVFRAFGSIEEAIRG